MEQACSQDVFTAHDLVFSVVRPDSPGEMMLVVFAGRPTVDDAQRTMRSVSIQGELDAYTSQHVPLVVAGVTSGAETVVVNLSGVAFIDCAGLTALEEIRDLVGLSGGRLWMHSPSSAVQRIIEPIGDEHPFRICSDAV